MTDPADPITADGAAAPYPGLRPFQPDEADIFCGRERAIDEVIARLGARNLVLVHGGSGCGKSSLVRAGVLPLLARRHALAGTGFDFAIMRPSEGPRRRLATLLAEKLGMPGEACGTESPTTDDADRAVGWWSEQIIFAADIVAQIEAAIERRGFQTFVLIVDQFEEVFPWTRERGRSDVDLLVGFLAKVATPEVRQRLFVLVTMRSDYIGQCAQFGRLGPVINDCQYFLRNLDDAGTASAIGEPAAMFGGAIDPALLSRLMFTAASQTDPLPMLQHSLMRMVQLHPGETEWTLTLDDLARVSGGSNALLVHANAVLTAYEQGDPVRRDTARWVFRALFEVDVGDSAIRRPTDFRTLVAVSGAGEAEVEALVAAFSAPGTNLLIDTRGADGERTIDISHEALLRNWDRMAGTPGSKESGWIREEFADTLTWRMLARYAEDDLARLDARTLTQTRRFMADMKKVPERARRYLLRPMGASRMEDEPEWKQVRALVRRSRRWAAMLVLASICFVLACVWSLVSEAGRAKAEAHAAEARAGLLRLRAERAKQKAEQDEKHAASSAVALAQADRENVALAAAFSALSRADDAARQQQAEEVATVSPAEAPLAGDGYVWIGDASVANLRDLLGARVKAGEARAGRFYVLGWPVKVRDGLPRPPNVSGAVIGSLPRNAAVRALEDARAAPNGQMWLKVRRADLPRVFLQYRTGADDAVQAMRRRFATAEFVVPAAQRLPQAAGTREVRYCYTADLPRAERAAGLAAGNGPPLPTRWIGRDGRCTAISSPGTIELWLGTIS